MAETYQERRRRELGMSGSGGGASESSYQETRKMDLGMIPDNRPKPSTLKDIGMDYASQYGPKPEFVSFNSKPVAPSLDSIGMGYSDQVQRFGDFRDGIEARDQAEKEAEAAQPSYRERVMERLDKVPQILRPLALLPAAIGEFTEPVQPFLEEAYTPGAGLSALNAGTQAAGALVGRLSPALAKILGARGGRIAETALREAAVGAPAGAGQQLAHTQDLNKAGEGALWGGALGGAFGGLGRGVIEGLDAGTRSVIESLLEVSARQGNAIESTMRIKEFTPTLRPADRSAYINKIVPELRARVDEIMTPPLENPNELAKWIKPHLGDDVSLNEIRKLSYEDMHQLAEGIRSGMSKAQIAVQEAKKMGYDLPTLLKGELPTIKGAGEKIPIFAPQIKISRPFIREPVAAPRPIEPPSLDVEPGNALGNPMDVQPPVLNTSPVRAPEIRERPIGTINGNPAETYWPNKNTATEVQPPELNVRNEVAAAREPIPLNQDEIPFTFDEQRAAGGMDDYSATKAAREAQRTETGTDEVSSLIARDLEIFDPTEINNLNGFMAYARDFYRNIETAMGQHAKPYIESFNKAKKDNILMQEYWLGRLKTEVVDKLGIKKDGKLSSLVQQFGEKKITLDELKMKAPKDWEKVIEADKWFRDAYDNIIDIVNDVRYKIYPNSPEKLVPKRDDYYRHFRELEGLDGLKNLFDTPANIDPSLAGTSDFTRPKTKFAGFMQRRGLGPYKNDAVGGFLNYLPSATHATHIDPETAKIRSLAQALRGSSADGSNNTFIEYLDDFANDLAGKTNPFDRAVQKVVSRKMMGAINWLSNRVKSNTILGNAGSTLAQTANIPLGIAHAKQYSAPGFVRTVRSAFKPDEAMAQSGFLKERFAQKMYRQFNTDWLTLKNPLHLRKFAEWTMETADRIGTNFIWNSSYEKALAESIENPIAYADDVTRKLVAGRGVGETPLFLKSNVGKLVAPFQLEVGNLWHVMADTVKKKDFTGLAVLFAANWLFNRGMEETRGSRVTFDPIQASIDAMEEGLSPSERLGRLGGEVLSNIPLGQTAAATFFPQNQREKLFGDNDPTRFGTGVPIAKGFQDPLHFLLPGFGGNQIRKTVGGIEALQEGASYTDDGRLKFPVEMSLANVPRMLLFGQNATPEAREYFANDGRPLGQKDTEIYRNSPDQEKFYDYVMNERALNRLSSKADDIEKDPDMSIEEKKKRLEELSKEFLKLREAQ